MSWRPLTPVEYLCDDCGASRIDFQASQFQLPKGWIRTFVAGSEGRMEARDYCPVCVAKEAQAQVGAA